MSGANPCPTDFALERHLLDPAASPLAVHLAGCDACRVRVARMLEEGERFRRFVYPATMERIEAAAAGPGRSGWWLRVFAPVAALGAAAAVAVVVLRPAGPPDGYVGVKGTGAVALTAFVRQADTASAVPDGGAVAPSAALRLRVRTGAACRLFVLSVDGTGSVSRLDGGRAEGLALPAGVHDLEGGVALDGAAGPERLFAVCAPGGSGWPDVERAARGAAAGGPDRLRSAASLEGLPPGSAQATLLLEKRP